MTDLRIGSVIISKKGIFKIAFLLFLIGVIIGANVASEKFHIAVFLPVIAAIFYFLMPGIKKEIRNVKQEKSDSK